MIDNGHVTPLKFLHNVWQSVSKQALAGWFYSDFSLLFYDNFSEHKILAVFITTVTQIAMKIHAQKRDLNKYCLICGDYVLKSFLEINKKHVELYVFIFLCVTVLSESECNWCECNKDCRHILIKSNFIFLRFNYLKRIYLLFSLFFSCCYCHCLQHKFKQMWTCYIFMCTVL